MDNTTETEQVENDDLAMDVDPHSHPSSSTGQPVPPPTTQDHNPVDTNDRYDVVIVSSVGLHVEGPIPFINPEVPIEQHAIVQIESNEGSNSDDPGRGSPTLFLSSDRESPLHLAEESNQSTGPEEVKESRKRTLSEEDNEDDGRLCPICLDNWTITGDHRICSLKCGHLFGFKCVNRWLQSQTKRSCPTCKKKVSRGEIRFIYANKLIAVDTSELETMRQQLELEVEEKNKMTIHIYNLTTQQDVLKKEVDFLKQELAMVTTRPMYGDVFTGSGSNIRTDCPPVRLFMDKSLEICRQGGCRVFDVNCKSDLIMTSTKSPNNLFSGYGIRKLNISQYKPLAFLPLHSHQIRDISFHLTNNWVLTASMDKSFKILDCISNSMITITPQTMPLWSCCWDADNEYVLYIGTQSGIVFKYDTRQLAEPVCKLDVPNDFSPVVSIASLPASPGEDLVNGGVISCKLNSLWAFEKTASDYKRHPIALQGPFISMKYQKETKQLLVSSRPNNQISYSRHTLCTLQKLPNDNINCNVIHSFQGGGMQKLLTKSCFISGEQEYVAAHQESSKSVNLWSINTGTKVSSVPANDTVLDLRGVQNQNGNFLVSLTEKKLEFFKFH